MKPLSELAQWGVNVYLTGGETADVGDLVRTIIVDSTVICRMKRSDVIETNIQPGDVIVGLASSGKAVYEKEYNSGIGSNGLTSARHDMFVNHLAEKYPESYDDLIPKSLVYTGKYQLTQKIDRPGYGCRQTGCFLPPVPMLRLSKECLTNTGSRSTV